MFQELILNSIRHYYWLLVLIAMSLVFGIRDTSSLVILLTIGAAFICIPYIEKFSLLDAAVIVFALYSCCTGIFNSYPYRLFYLGIRAEMVPVCFYFIARSSLFKSDQFFENMKKPLLFAMLCGFYLYFAMPSFYVSYKAGVIWGALGEDVAELSGHLLYEMTRFSSFWPHSYFMGYSSLFLFIFCSKRIVIDAATSKLNYWCLGISFFCLFFAQQRVSIAFAILYLIFLTIYAFYYRLEQRRVLYFFWSIAAIFSALIVFVALLILGTDFVDYVLNRTVNYEGKMVGDRFAQFGAFLDDITFFGKGLGRYGHGAVGEGFSSVPDCDYIRVPCEIGILGLGMLLSICVNVILKGFCLFKRCFFELFCLLFCLVAMLGAAPWELGTLQPFLYWFCIGHIQNKFSTPNDLADEQVESLEGDAQ